MTPAATVSGATPARTKDSTAGTPSRSRASARDTLPGLLTAAWVLDIMGLLVNKDRAGWDGGFIRDGRAGHHLRRPGSGRSPPAGRDQAGPPPHRGGGVPSAAGTAPAASPARRRQPARPGPRPVHSTAGTGPARTSPGRPARTRSPRRPGPTARRARAAARRSGTPST